MTLYLQKNYNGSFAIAHKLNSATREMFGYDYITLMEFNSDVPIAIVYERVQTLFGCKKLVLDF